MSWRRLVHALHRDLGFLALGMTVVYAVSGIAVNHRRQWDPNRRVEVRELEAGRPGELLETLPADRRELLDRDVRTLSQDEERALVSALAKRLGRGAPRNAFWRGPDQLSLYFGEGERDVVEYRPSTGLALQRTVRDRFLLRELNFLHRNEGDGGWTYVADAFALVLLFLAVSGVVMARGKPAVLWRGRALLLLGLLVPVIAGLLARR